MKIKKEVKKRIVNMEDKKVILSLAFVFIVGVLFSGSFTGNAGRIGVVTQLGANEYNLYEGAVKFVNGNVIRLEKISEDGTIVVKVVTNNDMVSRAIPLGQESYVNGHYITNIATNYKVKTALIRIN